MFSRWLFVLEQHRVSDDGCGISWTYSAASDIRMIMGRNVLYPCNIQLKGYRGIQQKFAFEIYRFLHTSLCHGLSSRIIVLPGRCHECHCRYSSRPLFKLYLSNCWNPSPRFTPSANVTEGIPLGKVQRRTLGDFAKVRSPSPTFNPKSPWKWDEVTVGQQLIPSSELRRKQRESERLQYIHHQAVPCTIVGRKFACESAFKIVLLRALYSWKIFFLWNHWT